MAPSRRIIVSAPIRTGFRRALGLLAVAFAAACSWAGEASAAVRADDRIVAAIHEAQGQGRRGDFEAAARQWKEAAEGQKRAGDAAGMGDSLLELAAAYHALGQQRLAVVAARDARDAAQARQDIARTIAALNSLGAIHTFSHEAALAEEHLREALALSKKQDNRALRASVLNNLAILLAAREQYPEATAAYRECAELAGAAGEVTLAAKARANLAETTVRSGAFDHAPALNQSAGQAAGKLPDGHDKAYCLMHVGKTWELIFAAAPDHQQKHRLKALKLYETAARVAEASGDTRALAYALGYRGHLYEQEKKWAEALALTRRAAFLAQGARAPDALYLWEWQTGRIDRAEGRKEEAIAAYRRAIRNLDEVRNDLSSRLGNVNARSSFRQAAGNVYFELADLLLQRADGQGNEADLLATLKEARDTCEQLKNVELEDYFQDDCVNLLKAKTKPVENIAQQAAIIYLVPLPDRTEIILSLGGKLERIKAPVGSEQLTETVRAFRMHLETRTSEEFLAEARSLYNWLIRPLLPLLTLRQIDTLVFVPDGALRTVPMGALHDGQHFLIERFAVAVTPGITLMEPTPQAGTNFSMITSGLTQAVVRDGVQFAALPHVGEEIAKLRSLYGGTSLVNENFRVPLVTREFESKPYSVVHIASHGEFSGDVRKTFVLTYDDKLTLDGLEHLIRPSQLREQPVELLSLSACQTAAGDDRAALGLAGVAVKAGARAAFATLWYVDDEASTTLILDFYKSLSGGGLSKAKALQRAQQKLLAQPRTSHPCLWAPYLIIGNWL